MTITFIGLDPGKSGAIAIHSTVLHGTWDWIKLTETEHDIARFMQGWSPQSCFAYLERVASRPGQGVSSTFKFGQNYGFLRGLLCACGIPFEDVTPGIWQPAMGVRSIKGESKTDHKRRLKSRAQQLHPYLDITNANADAVLLAHYCRVKREAAT